jgi:hypothetical protein
LAGKMLGPEATEAKVRVADGGEGPERTGKGCKEGGERRENSRFSCLNVRLPALGGRSGETGLGGWR